MVSWGAMTASGASGEHERTAIGRHHLDETTAGRTALESDRAVWLLFPIGIFIRLPLLPGEEN